ncbi:DUF1353 domain-containing protein [Streptomyces sp. RerS4]|uniref:DUF1353 domain-containing protein n=1 Tax=Streptomyces sp. RerS4 TaxID=2942449 RepID=UPI00201C1F3E|nr:DUF1353 domain-containing protein [Streptomyces sp. RerS4]UQW99564.1 DUF1353 domain-containing protein [Streptomyces sp. RerS4]
MQPARFYDGGVDADADAGQPEVPPDPGCDARIELVRVAERGREQFAMSRRIAYRDRHLGELLVPRRTRTFRSDLTSVPALFTWLVPKTGEHLPATLLHDGLIHPPGDPTYTSTDGHVVLRAEADRVLRDAMADSGTALIRRWLIWSAVATATMLDGRGTGWSKALAWRYRVTAALTVVLIASLGVCASFDLFDVAVPGIPQLPWMGERPWCVELVGGLSGAVVLPLATALLWGPFRIAGAVVGLSLALLLHVTVALLALTALYQVLERFTARLPRVALALAIGGTVVVLLAFAAVLVPR